MTRTVKTYRLGSDDYVTYALPGKRAYADRLEQTWGTVYSFIERGEIKGCIPEVWPRLDDTFDAKAAEQISRLMASGALVGATRISKGLVGALGNPEQQIPVT